MPPEPGSTTATRVTKATKATKFMKAIKAVKATKSGLAPTESWAEFKNDQDFWWEKYVTASEESSWVGCYFDDREVSFDDQEGSFDSTTSPQKWIVQSKYCPEKLWENQIESVSACAVYKCIQTSGEHPGMEAVMKIHMQLPDFDEDDPRVCPKETDYRIDKEVAALTVFRDAQGDVPGPRLIASKTEVQTSEMWVPGGFISITVMQKLPGTALSYKVFWGFPRAKRDEVRLAFRAALEKVWSVGITPADSALRNILWDEEGRKCYVVDFEDAYNESGRPEFYEDYDYGDWGLRQTPRVTERSALYHRTEVVMTWDSTTNLDLYERARRDADDALGEIIRFLAASKNRVALQKDWIDQMEQVTAGLRELLWKIYDRGRKRMFEEHLQITPGYLGRGAEAMYRFVRKDLGIPMHRGVEMDEVDDRTIGAQVNVIYEALRDGRVADLAWGISGQVIEG